MNAMVTANYVYFIANSYYHEAKNGSIAPRCQKYIGKVHRNDS